MPNRRFSWTSIQKFLGCQRAYELGYLENLDAKPSAGNMGRYLGSAAHAGIHHYLVYRDLRKAREFARKALNELTPLNVTYWDGKEYKRDTAFYSEMASLHAKLDEVLAYYLPQITERYKVALKSDVIPGQPAEPALEWNIDLPILNDTEVLSGVVDAVLVDVETGHLVIADWKTRQKFENETAAQVDGQLHLYAAMLNIMGANIKDVVMVEMRVKTPSMPEIGKKGDILTGRASYDTTWDYWVKHLPLGTKPEKYAAEMKPKMKDESHFIRWTFMPVTQTSCAMAYDNAIAAVIQMVAAEQKWKDGETIPAALGTHACKFCPFARLCVAPLRYGGDVSTMIETYYQERDPKVDFAPTDD